MIDSTILYNKLTLARQKRSRENFVHNSTISIVKTELQKVVKLPHYFRVSEVYIDVPFDVNIANEYINSENIDIKVDYISTNHKFWSTDHKYVFYKNMTDIKIFNYTIYKSYS